LSGYYVYPIVKRYSYSCVVNRFLGEYNIYYISILLIVMLIIIGFLYGKYAKYRRQRNIYRYLKECVAVADNKILNVTHALTDVRSKFGEID